jgi:uncharacterized protein (TIGR03083 family)
MTTTSITRPVPDRRRTITGLAEGYRSFAQLIGTLGDSDWTRETRCAGWQVRDVAAHVAAQAIDTVGGTIGSRTPDQQAAALRGEAPATLAAQLHTASAAVIQLATVIDDAWSAPSPVAGLTVGQGVHALLQDAYVHGDDVRAALGMPFDAGPGLPASIDFVLRALLRDESARTEPAIAPLLIVAADRFTQQTGIAAYEFLLAATGRGDPAPLGLPESVNIFR